MTAQATILHNVFAKLLSKLLDPMSQGLMNLLQSTETNVMVCGIIQYQIVAFSTEITDDMQLGSIMSMSHVFFLILS